MRGIAYHHTGCEITRTTRSNKDTITSCCGLHGSDHLQLGKGRDHKHEAPTNQMQEDQTETIWLWIYSGIVLLGTTTHFLATGGHSPETTSERTMNGSMGSFDAKGKGQPNDVLEAIIFLLAPSTIDCRGGLALLWHRLH